MNDKPQVENDPSAQINNLIDSMISHIPSVQQHVIDAEIAKNKPSESIESPEAVEGFDPEIHMTDENGNPKLTLTGKFRKKTAKKLKMPDEVRQEEIPAVSPSQGAAEVIQTLKKSVYGVAFGYDYGQARHKVHVDMTTAYFDSVGGITLTPLQLLVIMEGGLFIEAIRTEKGVKKMTTIKGWVAKKWLTFKDRKKAKLYGTYSSNRANPVGQNEANPEDSARETGKN